MQNMFIHIKGKKFSSEIKSTNLSLFTLKNKSTINVNKENTKIILVVLKVRRSVHMANRTYIPILLMAENISV